MGRVLAVGGLRAAALWLAVATSWAAPAGAIDLVEDRVSVHGYFEMQLRTIANDFDGGDGWDLTQWYNILNLELEADIAPDGFGPFDLVSAFARVEVRYDCVWTRGCGMFPNVDAFGDRAQHLPERLSSARFSGFTGTATTGDTRPIHNIPLDQLGFAFKDAPVGDGGKPLFLWHFPGVDTLFGIAGSDGVVGTADDPAFYAFERFVEPGREYRFASRRIKGAKDGTDNQFLGPWLPRNKVQSTASLADRANPFNPRDFNPVAGPSGSFGSAGLPYRPPPRVRASAWAADPGQARGMFLPNESVAELLRSGDFDNPDVNFRQEELAWNRGASQQDEKELKELYLDVELLDSRLWLRLGKQNIVWGKTELFRTTDQFNPQDLALTTLADLEESRIALWAARAVYSFYEVGPLSDVRLEIAANFDQVEPTDLGACGEAYTPNPVCDKSTGLFAHGLVGFGLAGEVRPPDPWNSWKGLEAGARLEFRWSRFSFAISDFWGYDDFPYLDRVFAYERNVDPLTGRPRRAGAHGSCRTGREAACLRGGDDALEHHHANQQYFAVICSASVGFSDLDRGVCAQSVFNSTALADPTNAQSPTVASALTNLMAGQGDNTGFSPISLALNGGFILESLGSFNQATFRELARFRHIRSYVALPMGLGGTFDVFCNTAFPGIQDAGLPRCPTPLVPLNRDPNDGPAALVPSLADPVTLWASAGIQPFLTDEQEALLGCGPFFGTRCDVNGVDLLNAELSAVIQSWPGFPGTEGNWDTTRGVAQPGTTGFDGGPVCTRYERGRTFILPGCRGPGDAGYDPRFDGSIAGLIHPFTGQQFDSELAALSWNLMMGLVTFSGLGVPEAQRVIDEFLPSDPLGRRRRDGCSFRQPQYCSVIQALYAVAHTKRATVRAGGNERYGRTDFEWHGGGSGVLRYEKRNVLGFSMDLAEDVTKSNWSFEATWIDDVQYGDNEAFDGRSEVDLYNLTVSVDRPTFVNFLNANRTFFINSQWFFQYIRGWETGFESDGPFNVLATLTIDTGYFDDRLLPAMTFVYDFRSNSGAWLPQVQYRYSANFSLTFGVAVFYGRFAPKVRPISSLGTPPYAVGRHKEETFVENGLSAIRDRDEVFLELRYTF